MSPIPSEQDSLPTRILKRLNLRFPGLFILLVVLTLADLVIPDPIPFADEIGLAAITMLLGLWKNRKAETSPNSAG